MRALKAIQFEIELVQREMAGCVIHQSDLDERLHNLDRKRAKLEKELREAINDDSTIS